jgi:hypothetical protein
VATAYQAVICVFAAPRIKVALLGAVVGVGSCRQQLQLPPWADWLMMIMGWG